MLYRLGRVSGAAVGYCYQAAGQVLPSCGYHRAHGLMCPHHRVGEGTQVELLKLVGISRVAWHDYTVKNES